MLSEFKKYFGHFRSILENLEKYFFKKFREVFRQKSKINPENFEKYLGKFRKILRNFENYFENFQKRFRNISSIITENFHNCFIKF